MVDIFVIKRQMTCQQGIKDHTTRPNVGSRTIIRHTLLYFVKLSSFSKKNKTYSDNFRTGIVRWTTACFQHRPRWLKGCHTEISDFDVIFTIEQKILRFQIPVAKKEKKRGNIRDNAAMVTKKKAYHIKWWWQKFKPRMICWKWWRASASLNFPLLTRYSKSSPPSTYSRIRCLYKTIN